MHGATSSALPGTTLASYTAPTGAAVDPGTEDEPQACPDAVSRCHRRATVTGDRATAVPSVSKLARGVQVQWIDDRDVHFVEEVISAVSPSRRSTAPQRSVAFGSDSQPWPTSMTHAEGSRS
jgi:hypothetical protein